MNFDERIKATMTLQQVHPETNCAERIEHKKEEEGVDEKTYASMDLLRGHLSILAWNLMLAICKLRLSLSMAVVLELDLLGTRAGRLSTGRGGGWWHLRGLQLAFHALSSYFGPATGGSTCCGSLSRANLS